MDIGTSQEIFYAILDQHEDQIKLFGTFSAPEGNEFSNPNVAEMKTVWGFVGAKNPIIGHKVSWDVDREDLTNRKNERHYYWLCIDYDEDDQWS